MNHPKQQHGNHTWDRVLFYHRCPKCGYINENKDKFTQTYSELKKNITCFRCKHHFTISNSPYAKFE